MFRNQHKARSVGMVWHFGEADPAVLIGEAFCQHLILVGTKFDTDLR